MMTMKINLKDTKKEKIKITNIDDFKKILIKEGYNTNQFDEEKFKIEIEKIFKVDKIVVEYLYRCINSSKTTYKANDVKHFMDYIQNIISFENEHKKLCEKISAIERLQIDRIEYDRKPRIQEDVEDILKVIEDMKPQIFDTINEEEKIKLEYLEKEIGNHYLFTKDIELLKKMILAQTENIIEEYNDKTQVKSIYIDIPKIIDYKYIKAEKGSVEYHKHLSNNIPRMKRLIKNMNKYMKVDGDYESTFKINQSSALQDSINIAVAVYDNKEFKAISGSNEIEDYCSAPPLDKQFFKSSKVNKLGKLGTGYNRVNDSEKKIFEEIHKRIREKELSDKGDLVLYSKWEPCPSCYFVINQFCKQYPNIDVKVKYTKKYGEN